MSDKIWKGMQHISDKWIIESDEDAVKKLFHGKNGETEKKPEKRFSKMLSRLAPIAACICLCACAVLTIYLVTKQHGDEIARVNSPVTNVSSADEMPKYLGFGVPLINGKEATVFTVYASEDNYAYMGGINYKDGSEYRMSRGSGDISGIFGGTLVGANEIDSVSVYFYKMAGVRYAIWNVNGYASCYYAAENETDYSEIIRELIKQIKA